MTNDELKALCESNARAIAALAAETQEEKRRRTTNTDEIETLLGAVSTNEVACRELRQTATTLLNSMLESNRRIDTNESRFDILLAELRSDRQRSDEQFARADERFNTQGQRIDRALDELAAQREAMRSLLSALATTNGRVNELEQAS